MSFDNATPTARAGHQLFRATLRCIANPGSAVAVRGPDDLATATALLAANWPAHTAMWCSNPAHRPAGRRAAPVGEAEVLLVEGPSSGGALSRAQRGTEERPEAGATLLYVVSPATAPATPVRLTGPGVSGACDTTVPLSAAELAARAAACSDWPMGVELLVLSGGFLIGLPRTTIVEVIA